ncbi:SDR family NAD(P)-dependent oxidoreductase [Novosphingobium colocasiae]|uniref:SDR family NAD(P)-dependent oxidoreductase n=1 Tax=Novosphingobium colocasiae TaxID=1256513 RepID=UPI0035B36342
MPRALIVGASRGLGRALAEQHLRIGWDVIATVRNPGALADLAQDNLQVEQLEITDWAAIDRLKAKMAGQPIDLLYVNAGIVSGTEDAIGDIEADGFAALMLTNVLAPLRIVDRFADLTADNATIAVMSSSLASIANNTVGTGEDYRISKAGLNMGLRSIAARRADKRTYLALDPGWVRTDMGGPDAPLSIEQSIGGLMTVLARYSGKGGSAFVNHEGNIWPW